ncbi:hypothetical protein PFISCL1PPCAC_12442, partial [Pristionchus fissidentatus]
VFTARPWFISNAVRFLGLLSTEDGDETLLESGIFVALSQPLLHVEMHARPITRIGAPVPIRLRITFFASFRVAATPRRPCPLLLFLLERLPQVQYVPLFSMELACAVPREPEDDDEHELRQAHQGGHHLLVLGFVVDDIVERAQIDPVGIAVHRLVDDFANLGVALKAIDVVSRLRLT